MSQMIFVNLPVADLGRSMGFYGALGFSNNPQFTDDSWRRFTQRPIPGPEASEVMLAISLNDRAAVDAMLDTVAVKGGTADINPLQDHGFMYSRAFTDPDGHIWEPYWMDPAVTAGA